MQNTTPAPGSTLQSANVIVTYGLFVLSVLAVLLIGFAWIFGRVDQTTAIDVIFIILGGNGLVNAAQWQAAPGLISQVQAFIGQLTNHIQALHQVQIQSIQPTDLLNTAKVATPGPLLQAPMSPIPAAAQPTAVAQLPFPLAPSSVPQPGGLQSAPITAQTWQRGVPGSTGNGG